MGGKVLSHCGRARSAFIPYRSCTDPRKRLRVHRVRAIHEVRMLQFIRSKSMKFQARTQPSSQSQGGSAACSLLALARRAYVSFELVDHLSSCASNSPHCRSYRKIDQLRGFDPGFFASPGSCGRTRVQAASSSACASRLRVADLAAISEKYENTRY
jgi:hypothetical protein